MATRDDLETLIVRLTALHDVWDDEHGRELELIRLCTSGPLGERLFPALDSGPAALGSVRSGLPGSVLAGGPPASPDRDILDQDPMLDDTARESIWDRPE